MRARIRLETLSDAKRFSEISSKIDGEILIKDDNGLCVNGKSFIGAMHAAEFDTLWVESDRDLYHEFREFII